MPDIKINISGLDQAFDKKSLKDISKDIAKIKDMLSEDAHSSRMEKRLGTIEGLVRELMKGGGSTTKVNLRPIREQLDEMEDTLLKKLSRLSLPKNLVIMDKRPQIVPSPS